MIKNKFTVISSWGTVEVCCETGDILKVSADSFIKKRVFDHSTGSCPEIDYCFLNDIQKFFIEEYIAFYGELHEEIDIITIGYWESDDTYIPPENDRRYLCDRCDRYDKSKRKLIGDLLDKICTGLQIPRSIYNRERR